MSKPSRRLQILFTATEVPNQPITQTSEAWLILPAGQERAFHFDSNQALCQPHDYYLEGLSQDQATGHCWYSWLQPTPAGKPQMSLRVWWREITYADGSLRIDGAVLNESMEAPIGRLKGKLEVSIEGFVAPYTDPDAVLSDENGCAFEFGELRPWLNLGKLRWYVNRTRKDDVTPPSPFWTPQPCPDARGGDAWQPGWTPFPVNLKNPDGSWTTPKYWDSSDPRNPPIGHFIGESKVSNWYARQTHSHYREGGEGFRTPQETGWQALSRKNDVQGQKDVLRALWEYTRAQVGGKSPTGQGYIDGRPNHLSLLSGELFRAGKKYNLNAQDTNAPFAAILHEGRPQIGKTGRLFWECFGRQMLHWIEVTASQFKGLYQLPNGQDGEHCSTEPLAAAAILHGDGLAMRQLHHICEEYLSNQDALHSTRSWWAGWPLINLANGFLVFQGNSVFGADAERYRDYAFKRAAESWQARFDETPYKGMITVGYEYMDQHDSEGKPLPESKKMGYEGTMQLAIALHAACVWYQLDGDAERRKFWLALIKYLALECLDQPGIIDWTRGGIIQRYSLQTPHAVPGGPSASELVEQNAAPNYQKRVQLSDEGWVVPALAEAWLVTGIDRIHDMALDGYNHQKLIHVGHNQETIYSPTDWSAWGTNYPAVQAFGWAT